MAYYLPPNDPKDFQLFYKRLFAKMKVFLNIFDIFIVTAQNADAQNAAGLMVMLSANSGGPGESW